MSSNTAEEIVRVCQEKSLTLAVAESLTGGLIASELVAVPGASAIFTLAVVAYTPVMKHKILSVSSKIIEQHGVVSEHTAKAMARGVVALSGADVAVATTGIAGPTASEGKPVGTVWIALAASQIQGKNIEQAELLMLSGGRESIRAESSELALCKLLIYLNSFSE